MSRLVRRILDDAVGAPSLAYDHCFLSTKDRLIKHTMKSMNCHGELDMPQISAKDMKTHGIAAIKSALVNAPEAVVSAQGKERFVVMDIAHYHYLRECELDAALAQTRADLAAGSFTQESPEADLTRLDTL